MTEDQFKRLSEEVCLKIFKRKLVSKAIENPCGFYHLDYDQVFEINSDQQQLLAESEDYFEYFEFERSLGEEDYKPELEMQLENYIGLLTLILKEVRTEAKMTKK